jgi:DNA invertase Pin-like site-specific DNA recombinase
MAEGKWISYLRVSTQRQGRSGLGMEAQRHAVDEFLNGGKWKLIKEFVEVESGKRTDRPQLAAALAACRLHGAKLVIAKMDRLSRNAHFLLGLDKAGVDFVAADNPTASRLTVGIMAMVAEEEGRAISARTKAALAAAKRRGVVLGGDRGVIPTKASRAKAVKAVQQRADEKAADLASTIAALQKDGPKSLRAIADGLNAQGIPTPRGEGLWTATQVMRIKRGSNDLAHQRPRLAQAGPFRPRPADTVGDILVGGRRLGCRLARSAAPSRSQALRPNLNTFQQAQPARHRPRKRLSRLEGVGAASPARPPSRAPDPRSIRSNAHTARWRTLAGRFSCAAHCASPPPCQSKPRPLAAMCPASLVAALAPHQRRQWRTPAASVARQATTHHPPSTMHHPHHPPPSSPSPPGTVHPLTRIIRL